MATHSTAVSYVSLDPPLSPWLALVSRQAGSEPTHLETALYPQLFDLGRVLFPWQPPSLVWKGELGSLRFHLGRLVLQKGSRS